MELLFGIIGIPLMLWLCWRLGKQLWLVNKDWFRVFLDTRLSVVKKEAERASKILDFPKHH